MLEKFKMQKMRIAIIVVIVCLVLYALGIGTNLFANPAFSTFFIIGNETAHEIAYVAVVGSVVAAIIGLFLLKKRKTFRLQTSNKPAFSNKGAINQIIDRPVNFLGKSKFASILLLVGLVLFFYSWYKTYPISLKYPGDVVFNHISPFYWISIPIVLGSLYLIGVFSKNQPIKCAVTVAIILFVYSLSFFYFTMPTSDSSYFRGLSQNFINTQSLNPSLFIHQYYQWPAFFLISDIATSVSGLSLISFEFFLYALIGSLIAATLYVYAAKLNKNGAIIAVPSFFFAMFYFLNYQAVPFSLALALLFAIFMLETRKKTTPVIVTVLILFFCISIAHSFVALFYILYLLFRSLVSRSKLYAEICLVATNVFVITQFSLSSYWIGLSITNLFRLPTEYSSIVSATLTATSTVPTPVDTLSQTLSRASTVIILILCLIGFVFLLIKRKLRAADGAIFLAGLAYTVLGLGLSSLGSRAISILFIPMSLGAMYFLGTKLKPYVIALFLIVLLLFVAIPIHTSFTSYPITFQTKDNLTTSNFMIEKYNWSPFSVVIADSGMRWYMLSQIPGKAEIDTNLQPRFALANITNYNCIIYTIGIANTLQSNHVSIDNTTQNIMHGYSLVYNSGQSYIAIKSK
jgi:hypothetical protein